MPAVDVALSLQQTLRCKGFFSFAPSLHRADTCARARARASGQGGRDGAFPGEKGRAGHRACSDQVGWGMAGRAQGGLGGGSREGRRNPTKPRGSSSSYYRRASTRLRQPEPAAPAAARGHCYRRLSRDPLGGAGAQTLGGYSLSHVGGPGSLARWDLEVSSWAQGWARVGPTPSMRPA